MNDRTERPRVLIVDDEPELVSGIVALLDEEGIDAVVTTTPFAVPFMLAQLKPHVTLVDLSMPSLSGEKLLTLIRDGNKRQDGMRLIIHSGRSRTELADLVETTGADGYLAKPTDGAQMIRQFQLWIACAAALRQERHPIEQSLESRRRAV